MVVWSPSGQVDCYVMYVLHMATENYNCHNNKFVLFFLDRNKLEMRLMTEFLFNMSNTMGDTNGA